MRLYLLIAGFIQTLDLIINVYRYKSVPLFPSFALSHTPFHSTVMTVRKIGRH